MSDAYPDPPEQPRYSPPPATANPYPNPYGAPQQPQPYGQPYGQPYAQPYGQPHAQPQPAPGYGGYGYPQAPVWRPGQVLGSSVLAYVLAGILVLSGAILLAGASAVDTFGNAFNSDTTNATIELAFDGFVDLLAAGLLIAGGVGLTGRKRRGRTMLISAGAVTLAECVYWVARTSGDAGAIVFVLLYGALATIAMVLALSGTVTLWLDGTQSAPPGAYLG